MINSLGNDFLFFYQIYDQYNKENKCDLLSLKNNEKYNFVPIVINYRNFINNKFFCLNYSITRFPLEFVNMQIN